MIVEKQCPLCGKIDRGIEMNGEFLCRECFGKNTFSPEELAEIEKGAAYLVEGLDDILARKGDT